ncbi:MAG: hypothetical protein HUK03_01160 [Bacteroidaceae bacterium]|nr:hypothetical protein [Bacteroidaceae bacterium]
MRLLGIYRGRRFSPNMTGSDASILDTVADALRTDGHEVLTISEEQLPTLSLDQPFDLIFGMMRDASTLRWVETRCPGIPVLNSLAGIRLCGDRVGLFRRLMRYDVPLPPTVLYDNVAVPHHIPVDYPLWLKRGDGHSEVREDVCYVHDTTEADGVLRDFQRRGVTSFVAQRHIEGDLIKFYGVAGSDFFRWRYASEGQSKFGLETINGPKRGYAFNGRSLRAVMDDAAHLLDVAVYGGDCVVDASGSIYLIDFNDWPSFASCRKDAAEAIAHIIQKNYGHK